MPRDIYNSILQKQFERTERNDWNSLLEPVVLFHVLAHCSQAFLSKYLLQTPGNRYMRLLTLQISWIGIGATAVGSVESLKSLRTLRALRPLRAISRWQGMKVRFASAMSRLLISFSDQYKVLINRIIYQYIFQWKYYYKNEFEVTLWH